MAIKSVMKRCEKCGKWFNASKVAHAMYTSPEVQDCLALFGGKVTATEAACPGCGHANSLDPPVDADAVSM